MEPETIHMGTRIRQLRKRLNMTQKEAADKLGISVSAISAYERELRVPSYDLLIRMAGLFDVSTDYLLMAEPVSVLDISLLSAKDRQKIIDMVGSMK